MTIVRFYIQYIYKNKNKKKDKINSKDDVGFFFFFETKDDVG